MNIFEQASRQQLRFPSDRGVLTVEQLWTLPLQSKSGFDLDTIAKAVNKTLKDNAEESFVATVSPANTTATLALDILKHIIAVKLDENAKARTALERKAKREQLLGILAGKETDALQALTPDEIRKQLAELEA
jgi:dTDP-4-dehydrorhamnose reductase